MNLIRHCAAELIGTALLLAAVVGSGIMAERLAGGSAGLALLANAIATGGALLALIVTFGSISGAHFNPLVTIALAWRGHVHRRSVMPYLVAQFVGAVLGVWLAHAMFELPILQVSAKARLGLGVALGEAVAVFGLLLLILIGTERKPNALPAAIAFYIVGAYWFTSSTSFANPAVTLARALTDSFAGIAPGGIPGYLAGQIAGAVLALGLTSFLLPGSPPPPGRATEK
ncbi:MAG: aquaporin [Alphaproteobacteria bacterium]